jgi:hypothetical protein
MLDVAPAPAIRDRDRAPRPGATVIGIDLARHV